MAKTKKKKKKTAEKPPVEPVAASPSNKVLLSVNGAPKVEAKKVSSQDQVAHNSAECRPRLKFATHVEDLKTFPMSPPLHTVLRRRRKFSPFGEYPPRDLCAYGGDQPLTNGNQLKTAVEIPFKLLAKKEIDNGPLRTSALLAACGDAWSVPFTLWKNQESGWKDTKLSVVCSDESAAVHARMLVFYDLLSHLKCKTRGAYSTAALFEVLFNARITHHASRLIHDSLTRLIHALDGGRSSSQGGFPNPSPYWMFNGPGRLGVTIAEGKSALEIAAVLQYWLDVGLYLDADTLMHRRKALAEECGHRRTVFGHHFYEESEDTALRVMHSYTDNGFLDPYDCVVNTVGVTASSCSSALRLPLYSLCRGGPRAYVNPLLLESKSMPSASSHVTPLDTFSQAMLLDTPYAQSTPELRLLSNCLEQLSRMAKASYIQLRKDRKDHFRSDVEGHTILMHVGDSLALADTISSVYVHPCNNTKEAAAESFTLRPPLLPKTFQYIDTGDLSSDMGLWPLLLSFGPLLDRKFANACLATDLLKSPHRVPVVAVRRMLDVPVPFAIAVTRLAPADFHDELRLPVQCHHMSSFFRPSPGALEGDVGEGVPELDAKNPNPCPLVVRWHAVWSYRPTFSLARSPEMQETLRHLLRRWSLPFNVYHYSMATFARVLSALRVNCPDVTNRHTLARLLSSEPLSICTASTTCVQKKEKLVGEFTGDSKMQFGGGMDDTVTLAKERKESDEKEEKVDEKEDEEEKGGFGPRSGFTSNDTVHSSLATAVHTAQVVDDLELHLAFHGLEMAPCSSLSWAPLDKYAVLVFALERHLLDDGGFQPFMEDKSTLTDWRIPQVTIEMNDGDTQRFTCLRLSSDRVRLSVAVPVYVSKQMKDGARLHLCRGCADETVLNLGVPLEIKLYWVNPRPSLKMDLERVVWGTEYRHSGVHVEWKTSEAPRRDPSGNIERKISAICNDMALVSVGDGTKYNHISTQRIHFMEIEATPGRVVVDFPFHSDKALKDTSGLAPRVAFSTNGEGPSPSVSQFMPHVLERSLMYGEGDRAILSRCPPNIVPHSLVRRHFVHTVFEKMEARMLNEEKEPAFPFILTFHYKEEFESASDAKKAEDEVAGCIGSKKMKKRKRDSIAAGDLEEGQEKGYFMVVYVVGAMYNDSTKSYAARCLIYGNKIVGSHKDDLRTSIFDKDAFEDQDSLKATYRMLAYDEIQKPEFVADPRVEIITMHVVPTKGIESQWTLSEMMDQYVSRAAASHVSSKAGTRDTVITFNSDEPLLKLMVSHCPILCAQFLAGMVLPLHSMDIPLGIPMDPNPVFENAEPPAVTALLRNWRALDIFPPNIVERAMETYLGLSRSDPPRFLCPDVAWSNTDVIEGLNLRCIAARERNPKHPNGTADTVDATPLLSLDNPIKAFKCSFCNAKGNDMVECPCASCPPPYSHYCSGVCSQVHWLEHRWPRVI